MDNGGASEGPPTSLADPASETALQLTVIVDEEAYTVAEGETQPVTVRLSADPKRTVVSPLMATPRGDATSGDYSVSASVTFDEGDTSETITFSATDDTEDDGDSVLLLPRAVHQRRPVRHSARRQARLTPRKRRPRAGQETTITTLLSARSAAHSEGRWNVAVNWHRASSRCTRHPSRRGPRGWKWRSWHRGQAVSSDPVAGAI